MRSVKLLENLVSPDRAFADRWYVTNGEHAVGPVNLDLLARGIESGKVPLDSFVRNEAWTVWRPLSDIAMVTVAGQAAPRDDVAGRAPPAAGRPSDPCSDRRDTDPQAYPPGGPGGSAN